VVEELEGTGKYIGLIGSLRCVDGTGREVCCVGSGLTDADRGNHGGFVNKIVEVIYEQQIDYKLIQPIFFRLREDKSEAEIV